MPKFELETPFTDVKGRKQTSVDARDHLTVGDFLYAKREAKATGEDVLGLRIIEKVCGLEWSEVLSLSMADVEALDKYCGTLFAKKAPAGEKP